MHSHLHTPYNASTLPLHHQHQITSYHTPHQAPKLTFPPSTDCEEIMTALDECHARGFIHKALGGCNDVKRDVNKCLAAERYARAKRNRDEAKEKRKKIERIWAEEKALAETGSISSLASSASASSGSSSAEK
ncbi:hypothetical protein ASPFODRAFT_39875 [Aspergillus luchuensis CBS 106.47]|uniref:COX assembly mitochondrial protein n=1 Tax=Aspergillus luchuensis (strain CBS 106.47) TaxID=1137211 RepID=A0A1M3U0G4_ASPLC|nr:hypothetical protein ASPFODRAFT_39875 [Aspergillus luchuensis CBS 106.47]